MDVLPESSGVKVTGERKLYFRVVGSQSRH